MQYNLSQIFPQLQQPLDPQQYQITTQNLQNNQFFTNLVQQIIEDHDESTKLKANSHRDQVKNKFELKDVKEFKDIKHTINRIFKKLELIKVPKGTVIYTLESEPTQGYFLVFGCVQLLRDKSSWQKLQQNDSHTIFKPQQRMQFLQDNYNIHPKNFHIFQNIFFRQKMIFKYLPSSKITSNGYFGFQEIMFGSFRNKVAIATQQCILLKMKGMYFEKYLKQIEEKRINYILFNIFKETKSEIVDEILPKFYMMFNSSEIRIYGKDQIIYHQEQAANSVYYLLNGQVTVSKDIHIEVPKKYLGNQNKAEFVKTIKINLHKMAKNACFGDLQVVLSKRTRQFTISADVNNTIVIKMNANLFSRAISQSISYEKQYNVNLKYKYSTTMQVYLRQKSSLIKAYFSQFQELDHKKKQKSVNVLLKNQGNFKQNQLYQLFKKQGIFYRDSFERLEGFQQFQEKYDPKRGAINRHKITSSEQKQQTNKLKFNKKKEQTFEQYPIKEEDIDFQTTKRTLMSPTKTSNIFQILNSSSPQDKFQLFPINNDVKKARTLHKNRSSHKFNEIKRDEAVFKRVLIKNGRYEISRQTNKANSAKAIVNHKFDEIIKQSMARKDMSIKRALMENRQDVIREEFHKTVSTLQQRSTSMSLLAKSSLATGLFTCKGAEQMRKKLQKFKYERTTFSTHSKEVKHEQTKLQDCIGFNKKPLSSQINFRRNIFSPLKKSTIQKKSPQKIILLNHMMKPIVYNSTQL